MRYLYNPVTGALDDVETPKLGEKYFASAETDEIIRQINEQHGPGTLFPASEAPQPENPYKDFDDRNPAANGGMMIGGGIIGGTDTGDGRTGFANIFLDEGKKSRFSESVDTIVIEGKEFRKITKKGNPNFGKYLYRTSKDGKEVAEYLTKSQLEKRVANPQVGKSPYVPSKGYAAELDDIRTYVQNQGGAKKLYLSDIVKEFGDTTKIPEGDQQLRDSNTERKIKMAIGEKQYAKLVKGGERLQTKKDRIIIYNKLVRDVNRGDKPLIDLSSNKTGVDSKDFTQELKPVELKMYKKMSPKIRSIIAKIGQPPKRIKNKDLYFKDLNTTTTKNFDAMQKKYPLSLAVRTTMLKSGPQFFNDRSYILATINRHIVQGGDKFSYVSGDNINNIKFKVNNYEKLNTNKFLTYKNMDLSNPMFEEAKLKYKDIQKLKKIEVDNPLKPGTKITLQKALALVGDKLVLDHLADVGTEPLNKLVISTQKANMSGTIKNLTAEEIKTIGRNEDRTFEDNVKRYTKYTTRVLNKKAKDPNFKIKTPTETIKDKLGTFRGEAQDIKAKLDASKFITNSLSRIPGSAAVLAPSDFLLSIMAGLPVAEAAASAGSYLLKDPVLGRAVNVPLALRAMELETRDPELMLKNAQERMDKGEAFLQGLVDEGKDFLQKGAGEQPDIDPFQAAEGGRVNYSNGSPRGPNEPEGDDFLNELEFKFNNIDDVTIDDTPTTFDDSKSKIAQFNDLLDYKNIPYAADLGVRTLSRIGEFGARVLPATGNLISDILQKPMFKTPSSYERTENYANMVDDTEVPAETQQGAKFVGGPIFKNFLKNLTPTSTEKLVGLDTLMNEEKKKMIARGDSSLMVKVGETAALGGELVAPIFPGLKLIKAFGKARNINKSKAETTKLIEQEIDTLAKAEGMDRREFLQVSGAVGTVALAKLLGISSELPKVAKVAEKVVSTGPTTPAYFLNLVAKIKNLGDDITQTGALLERQTVIRYKDYELTEDLATGRVEVVRLKVSEEATHYGQPLTEETYMSFTPGETIIGKNGQPVKTLDEYDEGTAFIRSDREFAGDIVDESVDISEDVIKDGTKFEDNLSDFGE